MSLQGLSNNVSVCDEVLSARAEVAKLEKRKRAFDLIGRASRLDVIKIDGWGFFFALTFCMIWASWYVFAVAETISSNLTIGAVGASLFASVPVLLFGAHWGFPAARKASDKLYSSISKMRDFGFSREAEMVLEGSYLGEALIRSREENPVAYEKLGHEIIALSKLSEKVGGTLDSDLQGVLAGLAGNLPTTDEGIKAARVKLLSIESTVVKELERIALESKEKRDREVEEQKAEEAIAVESDVESIDKLFNSFEEMYEIEPVEEVAESKEGRAFREWEDEYYDSDDSSWRVSVMGWIVGDLSL